MTQAPYPAQPPAPSSAVRFTVQGNALSSNLIAPTLTIDGHPAPTTMAGSTVIPVWPGPHRLQAHSQWLRQYGQAALEVQVPENTMVEVFYAPPYHQFTTGAMGLTQQTRKGVGCMVVALAFAVLVILLVVVAAISFG